MSPRDKVLTVDQLIEGYEKAISNAFRLLQAAMVLTTKFPDVALGLGEIGQEETGKSLSLLATIWRAPQDPAMTWLWNEWKNHRLKAHRAFLYELVCPFRLEIQSGAVGSPPGLGPRGKLTLEKEFSFYVNFDPASNRFVSPQEEVAPLETYNRVFTLLYLAVTAAAVKTTLTSTDLHFRYGAFSEIAFRICSENLYQQDMPSVFAEFAHRSPKHEALMNDLQANLGEGSRYLTELATQRGEEQPPPPGRGPGGS